MADSKKKFFKTANSKYFFALMWLNLQDYQAVWHNVQNRQKNTKNAFFFPVLDMGLNFYDYDGLQPKMTHTKHSWGECTCMYVCLPSSDEQAFNKKVRPYIFSCKKRSSIQFMVLVMVWTDGFHLQLLFFLLSTSFILE